MKYRITDITALFYPVASPTIRAWVKKDMTTYQDDEELVSAHPGVGGNVRTPWELTAQGVRKLVELHQDRLGGVVLDAIDKIEQGADFDETVAALKKQIDSNRSQQHSVSSTESNSVAVTSAQLAQALTDAPAFKQLQEQVQRLTKERSKTQDELNALREQVNKLTDPKEGFAKLRTQAAELSVPKEQIEAIVKQMQQQGIQLINTEKSQVVKDVTPEKIANQENSDKDSSSRDNDETDRLIQEAETATNEMQRRHAEMTTETENTTKKYLLPVAIVICVIGVIVLLHSCGVF